MDLNQIDALIDKIGNEIDTLITTEVTQSNYSDVTNKLSSLKSLKTEVLDLKKSIIDDAYTSEYQSLIVELQTAMENIDFNQLESLNTASTMIETIQTQYNNGDFNGTDGVDGADGQNGSDGKSAYQSWLDLGNSGTEQQFIDSLQGSDGVAGTNGTDGKSAYQSALDNGFVGTEADFVNSFAPIQKSVVDCGNISINNFYIFDNPFGNDNFLDCFARVKIYVDGTKLFAVGNTYDVGPGAVGLNFDIDERGLVIRTATNYIAHSNENSFGLSTKDLVSNHTTAQARAIIFYVG